MLTITGIPPVLNRLEKTGCLLDHLKSTQEGRFARGNIPLDVNCIDHIDGNITLGKPSTLFLSFFFSFLPQRRYGLDEYLNAPTRLTELLAREQGPLNPESRIPTPPMRLEGNAGMLGNRQVVSPILHVPSNGESDESLELYNLNSILRTIDDIINRAWFEQRALSQITARSTEVVREESLNEEERRRTL